jgi:hypothetical protein
MRVNIDVQVIVDDEMVERALRAFSKGYWEGTDDDRTAMRAALEAALQGNGEKG